MSAGKLLSRFRRFATFVCAVGVVSLCCLYVWSFSAAHTAVPESPQEPSADDSDENADAPQHTSAAARTTRSSRSRSTTTRATTTHRRSNRAATHWSSPSVNSTQHWTNWSSGSIIRNCSDVLREHNLTRAAKPSGYQIDGLVTRVVHQSWKSLQLPPRYLNWSLTWCQNLPDWQYALWTDEQNEQLVREHYAWFYPKYKSFRQNIYRIDSVRYIYMHMFGGVYTDLDNICLRNFEHVLVGRGIVWGDMEMWGRRTPHYFYIQNSWMYSRPGHPFWIDLLKNINELKPNENGRPEGATGPNRLMRVLKEKWDSYNDMVVYPPEGFNPFSWGTRRNSPCKDLNNMNDAELAKCLAHHKAHTESFVLQLHTQSWGSGKAMKRR